MIAVGGTFAPGEDSEELFADKTESALKFEGCEVCGAALTDPMAKTSDLRYSHALCVHNAIETGLYSTSTVRSLENRNNITPLALLKDHPSVNRCVLCGGSWGREEKLGSSLSIYTARPAPSFAHTVCVANAVHRRELSAQRISSIAWESRIPVTSLFPNALQRCVYCSKAVDDKALLTHDGALAHRDCLTHLYQSGQMDELQAADTLSLNYAAREILGESPRERFNKKAALGALIAEAQGFIAGAWNKFVGWVKDIFGTFEDTISAYDEMIGELEQVAEQGSGSTSASVVSGIRAEWVRDADTHDVIIVSSAVGTKLDFIRLSDILHKFLGVRPSRIVAAYGKEDLDWREVLIPKTAIRTQMLRRLGISSDVEQSMELVAAIELAEKEHARTLQEIQQRFSVVSMKKGVEEAEKKILGYIQTLANKQRKFGEVVFRVKQAVRRTSTSYPPVIAGLKEAYSMDKALTAKIDSLLKASTTAAFTYDALETVLPEIPSEVRKQLSEISVPEEAASPVIQPAK